ncbi:unnamed protein product [Cunninghamella echinulata]
MIYPKFDLSQHATSSTIKMMACILDRIVFANDRLLKEKYVRYSDEHIKKANSKLTPYVSFRAQSLPSIAIEPYLARILKYCPCIMVSSKFFSDVFYTNTRYAKVGGISVSELNALELTFLKLNDFNLNISVEELERYGNQLLVHWIKEKENWRRSNIPQDILRSTSRSSSASVSSSSSSSVISTGTSIPSNHNSTNSSSNNSFNNRPTRCSQESVITYNNKHHSWNEYI